MKKTRKIKGFAFIGNPIEIQCRLPFQISEELVLRRAHVSQRSKIKRYLKSLGGHSENSGPFERVYEKIPEKAALPPEFQVVTIEHKALPSPSWRYYVVDFKECTISLERGCEEITNLRAASRLTNHSLRLNPVFTLEFISTDFTSDWEYFTNIAGDGGDVARCDEHYFEDLRNCYLSFLRLLSTHPDIARSIRMFNELPHRLGHNELTTLGLFSVLESLLTHSPRGEHDSISHQIRKKVSLLEKRFPEPVEYSSFGQASRDTIWTKLYDLRSRIAHGGKIDFDRSLALLVDSFNVESFLKLVLRALLRGALEEPNLYSDLKVV